MRNRTFNLFHAISVFLIFGMLYIKTFFTKHWVRKNIGSITLFLDLNNRHEKNYFEETLPVIDDFILPNFLTEKDNVLDLGANIGYESVRYLQYANRVYAFEPIPWLYSRLKAIEFQSEKFSAFPWAIIDVSRNIDIFISKSHNQGHSTKNVFLANFSSIYGEKIKKIEVKGIAIDDWNITEKIDFVKIDIEGSEMDFFKGGKQFLSKNNPIIQIEIYDFIFQNVISESSSYYSHIKRCIVEDKNKKLILVNISDIEKYKENDFIINPPTYILFNDVHLPLLNAFFN